MVLERRLSSMWWISSIRGACAEYEQSVRQLARTHIEKPAP